VAIEQALQQLAGSGRETSALHELHQCVAQVVLRNAAEAADLQAAHTQLVQIAHCLHYPPKPALERSPDTPVSSQTVRQAIDTWLRDFHPTGTVQSAQRGLHSALKKRWEQLAGDLLHCYDLHGLPPDNLQLEGLFGRLRRHQRRISGRKTTQELQRFGQAQVLFRAHTQSELLHQLQQVPYSHYRLHRNHLDQLAFHATFFRRLHRDPLATIQHLLACLSPAVPQ